MTRERAAARWIRFGTPVALFGLALAVRASPWREVFAAGHVVPPGQDAYYHLRRIVFRIFQGADLEFDRYLNHPIGAKPIWPPLFDLACAAGIAPFVDRAAGVDAAQARIEMLAAWIPPLLGALTVVLVFELGRRHFGGLAGAVGGGVLCLLSAHFWYSQLGFVDHHVAVAAAATGLLGAALGLIRADESGRVTRAWTSAAAVGAASALCLLLWPGSLLHVGLVHAGLLAYGLTRPQREAAVRFAGLLAAGYVLALVLVAPAGLGASWPQWSRFSPVVLSRFQPLLLAAAAILLGACALGWRATVWGSNARRRAASFALLGLALAAFCGAGLPELREGAVDAWRWLAKREAFQSRVSESLPLLVNQGRIDPGIAMLRLSWLGFALPLLGPWLVWRHRRRPEAWRTGLIVIFALGLLAVTLLQKRFFDSASVGVALVSGMAFAELWRLAAGGSAVWRGGLVGLLALALLPTLEAYRRPLVNEWRAWKGERPEVTGDFASRAIAFETARWLRDHTPPTRGWLDPDAAPEYGVLAPWPLGHLTLHVARRPTLVGNFGDDLGEEAFAFAARYYLEPESAERVEEAGALGLRYVLVQGGSSFLPRPPGRRSLARALYARDGSGVGDLPALEHHRLVHESSALGMRDGEPVGRIKVYERVAGAVLVGRAGPGREISLELRLRTAAGRGFHYRATRPADDQGRYRFRVPYAAEGGRPGGAGVRAESGYRLRCGDREAEVGVAERAVRRGDRIDAPDLCLDDAGAS